jgi:ribonucleoside-diphosphate reductase alpha chain
MGETKKVNFGCGNVYMTVNRENGKPIQILMQVGKAGCCQKTLLEGMCRLANRLFDRNAPIEEVVLCLAGLRCDQGIAGIGRLSCADALAQMLKAYMYKPETEPTHDLQMQPMR